MTTIHKVRPLLVTEDFSAPSGAEARSRMVRETANRLAQRLGAAIEIVHVTDDTLNASMSTKFKTAQAIYLKAIKTKLSNLVRSFSVPTKTHLLVGDPLKEVLSLTEDKKTYEMIILGTRGRKGLSRIFLGSVAEEIIRHARIPVMTLGPRAQKSPSFLRNEKVKILIPTLLNSNSVGAEKFGLRLAALLNAEVIFFHSIYEGLHPVLQTAFSVPNPPPAIRSFFQESIATAVKQLSSRARRASKQGVSATYALDEKCFSASASILKEIDRSKISIVVIGTHGRSMFAGAFFGRTARDVILESSIPVITVYK